MHEQTSAVVLSALLCCNCCSLDEGLSGVDMPPNCSNFAPFRRELLLCRIQKYLNHWIAYFFMQKNAVFVVLSFLPSSGSNLCVFIKYFQYVHENAYCTTHSALNYAVALCLEKFERTKDLYLTPWNFSLHSVQQYKQV